MIQHFFNICFPYFFVGDIVCGDIPPSLRSHLPGQPSPFLSPLQMLKAWVFALSMPLCLLLVTHIFLFKMLSSDLGMDIAFETFNSIVE